MFIVEYQKIILFSETLVTSDSCPDVEMKPLAHWPSKYKNEVEICGDTFYQIKRESETAMKRFLTLTIYFDLGKPNAKSFQSMFNLNQLHFREIFLIRFACKIQIAKFKGVTGKSDIDL